MIVGLVQPDKDPDPSSPWRSAILAAISVAIWTVAAGAFAHGLVLLFDFGWGLLA